MTCAFTSSSMTAMRNSTQLGNQIGSFQSSCATPPLQSSFSSSSGSGRPRTFPIPIQFATLHKDPLGHHISFKPLPNYHFHWVRYFSVFRQSQETTHKGGIQMPSGEDLRRARGHDLLGEAICEMQKMGNMSKLYVHISIYVWDLKPLLKFDLQQGLPVYLKHHELRRLQKLNPFDLDENFALLPSLRVKLCTGSHIKCESINKIIALKLSRSETRLAKEREYVPCPNARKPGGVSPHHGGATKPALTVAMHLESASTAVGDDQSPKHTIDFLTHSDSRKSFNRSETGRDSLDSFSAQSRSDSTRATSQLMSTEMDCALHTSSMISAIIRDALEVHQDDIRASFDYAYARVKALLFETGGVQVVDDKELRQSIWRGLEEVSCGGTLSFLSDLSAISGFRLNEADEDDGEPLPVLTRQDPFSMSGVDVPEQVSVPVVTEEEILSPSEERGNSSSDATGQIQAEIPEDERQQRNAPISSPLPQLSVTHREEEILKLCTSERVIHQSSLAVPCAEASKLLASFEVLKEDAVPFEILPEAYDDWLVSIIKPAELDSSARRALESYREVLLGLLSETGSSNFILSTCKKALIDEIASYVHERLASLAGTEVEVRVEYARALSCNTQRHAVLQGHFLAKEVVGEDLLRAIGIDDNELHDMTFKALQGYMNANLGVQMTVAADSDDYQSQQGLSTVFWKSNLEQLSRFTWYTCETVIDLPSQGRSRYKVLKPQLFRSPEFSTSLIARESLSTLWNNLSGSQRKVLNEQLTLILKGTIRALEAGKGSCLVRLLQEGARSWVAVARKTAILADLTEVEWEILFADFVLDGIYCTAIQHLRELC